LDLWSKIDRLDESELNLLKCFNLEGAIREFTEHLEIEGFIQYYHSDYFLIVNDRLPNNLSSETHKKLINTGANEIDLNSLSVEELECFQERAGIHEFCGGMLRKEAEKLAYLDLFKD